MVIDLTADNRKRKMKFTSKIRKRLTCGGCFNVWEYRGVTLTTQCPLCGKLIDARDRTEYARDYAAKHPERKHSMADYYKKNKKHHSRKCESEFRRKVLVIVGKSATPSCAYCGCDDSRLLEVNHINGGGAKELKGAGNAKRMYADIVALRRPTDDLNLLCKICNARHYLELKHGELPFKITWGDK